MQFIDDIPAGLSIDRLIAEYVLGWQPHTMIMSPVVHCSRCGRAAVGNTFCNPYMRPLAWSSNVEQAFQVLNLHRCKHPYVIFVDGDRVSVEINDDGGDLSSYAEGSAKDIPLAACRALLKLVMGAEHIEDGDDR